MDRPRIESAREHLLLFAAKKLNFALEQAMKAQSGKGIALPFL
jgi:hypothetical protein